MALIEAHVTAQAGPATIQLASQVLDPTEVFKSEMQRDNDVDSLSNARLPSQDDVRGMRGVTQ